MFFAIDSETLCGNIAFVVKQWYNNLVRNAENTRIRKVNTMKKILALALALVLVLSMGTAAFAEEKTIKVGIITDVGGINDKSFNQTTWEGMLALMDQYPNIEAKYLESKADSDYNSNIETFVDEDYDLIICVGYMLAGACREGALNYPDQKFAIIDDASNADLPNVACLMFSQQEASYLVGIVAGMMTESNTIGYVQGMVSDTMNLFGIGYIAGAKSVNPDVEVLQYNANSFVDATIGSAATTDMITKGADVIYHAAGGTGSGVIEACATNGVWAIGVDTDQSPLAPEYVVTSAMKRVDTAAQDISLAVLNDTFQSGEHLYELANGGVDIAPTTTLLSAEVIEAVEAAKASIIAGETVVPSSVEELGEGLFTLAE